MTAGIGTLRGRARAGALLLLLGWGLCLTVACGYRVAGRGRGLPPEWKTIAVPAFANRTLHPRMEQRLTDAVIREFLARTKYRIVQDEAGADAVLKGEVTTLESSAVLFDTATGRATTMLVTVKMKVHLVDQASAKTIYENNEFAFREEYEISADVASFFDEQEPALGRLAHDFAATLVSAILENF